MRPSAISQGLPLILSLFTSATSPLTPPHRSLAKCGQRLRTRMFLVPKQVRAGGAGPEARRCCFPGAPLKPPRDVPSSAARRRQGPEPLYPQAGSLSEPGCRPVAPSEGRGRRLDRPTSISELFLPSERVTAAERAGAAGVFNEEGTHYRISCLTKARLVSTAVTSLFQSREQGGLWAEVGRRQRPRLPGILGSVETR